MTATKGKVQERQVELQLHKNPNTASTFTMSKEERELIYLELFLIPEERGNSQEPAGAGVSQRVSTDSTALPLSDT